MITYVGARSHARGGEACYSTGYALPADRSDEERAIPARVLVRDGKAVLPEGATLLRRHAQAAAEETNAGGCQRVKS